VSQQTTNRSLDELAKGLATGTLSRGKAIRWMGGAILGAALASFPGVAWANDCRRLGRECRRDSQCCSRNCIRRGDDKVCGCPEGQDRCNDRCVNLQRNENHCGRCGKRCAEGEECVNGRCQSGGCPGTPLTEGDCNCASICPDQIPTTVTCQDNPDCTCLKTAEGTGFCAGPGPGPCQVIPTCSTSDDCEPGLTCVVNTCCESPICLPPCTPTCAQNGSICTGDSECCSGICNGNRCDTCVTSGACSADRPCCGGLCVGGLCGD
jgi:hypothetical protein